MPRSTSLSTMTEPPLFSTILLIRNKPIPLPSDCSENLANGVKTRSLIIDRSIPDPLSENTSKIFLIDGLGHGNSANAAAMVAVNTLVTNPANNPVDELRNLHDTLKKTRGAVVNVAHFDKKNKQLYYSGVGNISMRIITPNMSKGCFSYNGIVGHILPASLNNHQMQWNEKVDTVVMHSDGLTSRWDLQKYPGLLNHHGTVISAALYKDHNRGSDDSTVIVGKFAKRLNG